MSDAIVMTEYLGIDPTARQWVCLPCKHVIGPADSDYKRGLLLYDRDPRDIYPVGLPGERGYAPDPNWCRIVEYYCPNCATQIETEYLPPGHPLTRDMDIDVDALIAARGSEPGAAAGAER
ncbi:acetone carboxylase subunit gamma [[Mycobacterium] wendilense]|uniref:Acetone carboxylase subunit gamma n=1 Tax=[Mycobacterium] wendilense TaxID=3064284 RepID=A0ABM9MET2_9MYCO|nr:acetone carboxylase subunit gamma [Mycolicibacterium sp. MU0050]CAJ1583543.1 acetone carboxylase subunit gamma [Mycolicibacterium sp. MU0050]